MTDEQCAAIVRALNMIGVALIGIQVALYLAQCGHP